MDNLKLGQIIEPGREVARDAIHIAVAPAIARGPLYPGDRVDISKEGFAFYVDEGGVGLVDPYLKEAVSENEMFWILLYPGSIKGLRHEWSHPSFDAIRPPVAVPQESASTAGDDSVSLDDGPAFPGGDMVSWPSPGVAEAKVKAASEAWLRAYAKRVNRYDADNGDVAYEHLMRDIAGGHSITYHGTDMHSFGELEEADELQRHAQIVLGKMINWGSFEYFSCSC